MFWIFTGVFGCALSPLFPASLAWANSYVKMTAMMTAIAFIASAIGISIEYLDMYLCSIPSNIPVSANHAVKLCVYRKKSGY